MLVLKRWMQVFRGPEGGSASSGTPSDQGSEGQGDVAAPETSETSAGVEGAGGESRGDSGSAVPPPPKPQDWKDRRIGKLSASKADLQRQLDERNAELTRLRAGAGVGEARFTQVDLDRLAEAKAQDLAGRQEWLRRCEDVRQSGLKLFPKDFDAKITAMAALVDKEDQASVAGYSNLIQAAMKTGSAAQVLHHIAGDLDEAQRLLDMAPVDQALAVAKLVTTGDKRPTSAPDPISRTRGDSGGSGEIDPADPERAGQLSTAEWMRRRQAQVDKKKGKAA